MARNITLTLGVGLGADLGPNFNLTANVGSVTPSTATKRELTAGKRVSVDDAATQVTVTSTGTCTNSITQTIPCGGTTTTTTAATTTTTTAAPSNCIQYSYTDAPANVPNDLEVRYRDCVSGNIVTEAMNSLIQEDNGDGTYTYFVCVDQSSSYSTPVCVQGGIEVTCPQSWVMGGSCGGGTTTTTTEAPTTTTTTAGINYIAYPADKYVCDAPSCGAFVEATEIAFPDTFTPVINKWYSPPIPNGYAYQLTSTTPSAGPGLVMYAGTFNTCGLACSI